MIFYLKQSTASQSRAVGPFIDDTDFKTLETGLTIANTDVKLVKNGAASVNKNSGGGTHRVNGTYSLTFDATDSSTVGSMLGSISVSGALVVLFRAIVLEEAVYDALFGASAPGYLQPTVATRTLDITATGTAGIDLANVENQGTTLNLSATTINLCNTVTTLTGHTVQTGDNFARLGAPAGASVSADIAAVKVDTAAVKVKTDFLPSATAGAAGGLFIAGTNAATVVTTSFTTTFTGNLTGSVASVTGAVGSVTGAVGSVTGAVGSVTAGVTIASGGIIVGAFAANAITAAALATDAVNEIRDAVLPTQNVAFANIAFNFVTATDPATPVTGATGTAVTRSLNGGAFGAGTGTISEVGNGGYSYDASAADMNAGVVQFRFVATGGTPSAPRDTFVTMVTGGGV